MSEEQKDSEMQVSEKKSLRPVLIVSKETISEYSMFLKHLLVGLADESIPSVLVCPPGCDVESVVPIGGEVIRHPVFELPLMWRPNRKILIEKLEGFGPNILHCLCQSKALLTRQLAKQLHLPYVLTVNSLQKLSGRFSLSSKRLAKIIAPSESVAANLAQVYPKFAEQIERINIGAFTTQTSSCFSHPDRLASIVAAHPLMNESDFENLFGAVKHLVINNYEFMLVITGSGRAEQGLRKLLVEMGLSETVIIVPRLEPSRAVLAAGDIFIQLRPSNAFNPLLLEAMSVGAAVAGCKGGVDDLIIEGQTAAVFDPDDELSIYDCLQRLLDSRETAQQIAKGAQEYIRENHSVSKMVGDILRTYSQAQQWYGR